MAVMLCSTSPLRMAPSRAGCTGELGLMTASSLQAGDRRANHTAGSSGMECYGSNCNHSDMIGQHHAYSCRTACRTKST